jgi:hypothetical protein
MPSVVEATASMDRLEPWHVAERLLYAALPVTYLWLLMFYLVFHLFLNLLAELLRFGDRVRKQTSRVKRKAVDCNVARDRKLHSVGLLRRWRNNPI